MIAGGLLLLAGALLLLRIAWLICRQHPVSSTTGYLLAAVITLDVLLPAYDFNPITPKDLVMPPAPEILTSSIRRAGDARMAAND
jgi:hypothetical protein